MLLPLLWMTFTMKGNVERPSNKPTSGHHGVSVANWERNLVFTLCFGALLFVPIFKTITHLPPFMGVMLGLGIYLPCDARAAPVCADNQAGRDFVITAIVRKRQCRRSAARHPYILDAAEHGRPGSLTCIA